MRHDNFITHPYVKGASIRADALIQRCEQEAHKGCGLFFEIFEIRLIEKLNSIRELLPVGERTYFTEEAEKRGWMLDGSFKSEYELLNEIRAESV